MRVVLAAFALLVSGPGTAAAQVLEAQVAGRIEPLSVRAGPEDYASAGPEWWNTAVSRIGTGFLRLHITVDGRAGDTPAILGVEGSRGGRFSYALSEIGPEGLWTGLLPSGTVVATLVAFERPDTLSVAIDAIMVEAETGTPFSIWGGVDETVHINDPSVPEPLRTLSSSVARLSFVADALPRNCTGFLIAPDLLVTNQHCVDRAEVCRSTVVLFGYQYDAENRLDFGRQFRCAEVLGADFDLDVALLRLDRPAGEAFGTLGFAETDGTVEAPLAVVQHPGGKPKQVSFVHCAVLAAPVEGRAPGTDLAHSCDTAEGSSGAPVLDAEGRLVALHHYGFASGQVAGWEDNRAVLGSRVREWLEAVGGL